MYNKKKMTLYALYLVLGVGIVIASIWLDDHSFWGGFGGAIAGVGGMRLYLGLRYRKDAEFAKKTDYTYQDERMLYLADKARSVTFILSVLALALASIVLRFCQMEPQANLCAWILMGMVAVYWLAYWLLGKKY
ncbi:MAG: hypothetical protein Q4F17_08805 [Eubacteriales bacterium]|nr:hypothetical protein [Eubacteriales bacterium]